MTHRRLLGLAGFLGATVLTLAACSNEPEPVQDIEPEVTQDTFEEEISVREGDLGRSYDTGDIIIQVNSVDLFEADDADSYFQYQPVHVNATIENTTDETQEFDVWSQLRVGSVRDRDSFGALQLSTYGLDELDTPEMNDNLFIELEAGETVTYDFLFDVIVPEEDNDVHVIYQINPMNHYDEGYITWEIAGFSDLDPSEVEEIDWDDIEDDVEDAQDEDEDEEDEDEEESDEDAQDEDEDAEDEDEDADAEDAEDE